MTPVFLPHIANMECLSFNFQIRQTAQDLYLFKDNVSGRSALVYGQTAGGVPQRDARHGNRNPHTARDREREKNKKLRDTTPSKEDRNGQNHHSHHRTAEQSSPEQRRSPKPSRVRSVYRTSSLLNNSTGY